MRPLDGPNLRLTWVPREDFPLVFGQNGQKLNPTVTLTTATLRDGWSQKEWVRTKKAPLAVTQLQYLNGEVLSEEITGIQAIVMVNAHISTIVGEQMQRERYRLLRVKGQWLIDSIKVLTERVLGEVM